MAADDKEVVEWQLKYLSKIAGALKNNDLEWSIRMEESYKNKGFLTEREMTILDNIYKKY